MAQQRGSKRDQRYRKGGKVKPTCKPKKYAQGGTVRGGGAATSGLKFTRDG